MIDINDLLPCPNCENDDRDNVEINEMINVDEFEPQNPPHRKETPTLSFQGDDLVVCGDCGTVLNEIS